MITRVRPVGVLVGYAVEAVDGPVGTIHRGTYDTGRLVVTSGSGSGSIDGAGDGAGLGDGVQVTVPVDAVQRIDHRRRTVYLGVSRASVAG
ncbi:hypothetical protein AB0K00_05470 [Dactylosporangium sp. NPDC049525]|uniref:hypothetical protein n=1 Tax=Dactylosporangium sp. NPDC049525 TaxID=3154730 RepID=UPI003429375D